MKGNRFDAVFAGHLAVVAVLFLLQFVLPRTVTENVRSPSGLGRLTPSSSRCSTPAMRPRFSIQRANSSRYQVSCLN